MKRINLDQMKNMPIDNLIELYRDGYRLEENTSIRSLSNFSNPNIYSLQGPLLDPVVNFGKVTVSTGYDATASSIVLNTNQGSKLPDPSVSGAFNLVWYNSTDYPDPSDDPNKEIVRCSVRTTDTLTVTRAQEGTSASVKNLSGKLYKMILSVTAKTIIDISNSITARVAKSGDTMTGTLNLPSNGLAVGTNQLIVSGGNIGIGTTSPTQKLDIVGNINLNGGYLLNARIQRYNDLTFITDDTTGNVRGLRIMGDSGISPITTEFRQWNFSTGVGTSGNIVLLRDGGNVGIGTISPSTKLHIDGGSTLISNSTEDQLILKNSNALLNPTLLWERQGEVNRSALLVNPTATTGGYYFRTGGSNGQSNTLMLVRNNGNVGIGTTAPAQKLHLSDSTTEVAIRITNTGTSGRNWGIFSTSGTSALGQGNFILYDESTGGIAGARLLIDPSGNIGIGTTLPSTKLEVKSAISDGSYSFTDIIQLSTSQTVPRKVAMGLGGIDTCFIGTLSNHRCDLITNSIPVITMLTNGNVGIGISTPGYKLDVNGNIKVPIGNKIIIRDAAGGTGSQQTELIGFSDGALFVHHDNTAQPVGITASVNFAGTRSTPIISVNQGGIGPAAIIQGNVGIGTSTPGWLLHVNGAAAKPGGGTWTDSSDIRLKKNINPIENSLQKLLQLKGMTFEWDEPERSKLLPGTQLGMIAQDVEKVFPQWVSTDNKGYKDLTFRGFEALTVEGIRELYDRLQNAEKSKEELIEIVKNLSEDIRIIKTKLGI